MLRIDYKSGLPIYDQIYRGIVKMAAAGAFGGDGQLPSVRSVAQELGVNPNTVQKAYGLLERDGVICSLPGIVTCQLHGITGILDVHKVYAFYHTSVLHIKARDDSLC